MRIKSKWHNNAKKTLQEMASAISFSSWRLTKNQLEDLINEGFKVEKTEVFGVIKVYLYFIISCVDRLVFDKLSFAQRQEFITAVVKQCSFYYQDNKADRMGGDKPTYAQEFIDGYNEISKEYAKSGFKGSPNYDFLIVFAGGVKDATTKVDEKWITQQIVEIQAPDSFEDIENFTNNIVNVKNIISKEEKSAIKKNKVSRSNRQQTASQRDNAKRNPS
jgi:hypothetical protein